MDNHPQSLLMVCFGDSLTAGYQMLESGIPAENDCPYGGYLQKWLGPRGRIMVSGICGELTREMVARFSRDVVERAPVYAVILGGTNDLGWELDPSSIHHNLTVMYRQAMDAGIRPVGVTVPSLRVDLSPSPSHPLPPWLNIHIERRFELNRLITDSCAHFQIPCVDLFSETVEEPSGLLKADYSSDGLHLNTKGYERFAKCVWDTIFAEEFDS